MSCCRRGNVLYRKLKTDLALTLVKDDLGNSTAIGIAWTWGFSGSVHCSGERTPTTAGMVGKDG